MSQYRRTIKFFIVENVAFLITKPNTEGINRWVSSSGSVFLERSLHHSKTPDKSVIFSWHICNYSCILTFSPTIIRRIMCSWSTDDKSDWNGKLSRIIVLLKERHSMIVHILNSAMGTLTYQECFQGNIIRITPCYPWQLNVYRHEHVVSVKILHHCCGRLADPIHWILTKSHRKQLPRATKKLRYERPFSRQVSHQSFENVL